MNELGRDSRELVDSARAGDDPAPDEKTRMRLRLAQLGVGMAVTTASATAAGGAASAGSVAGTAGSAGVSAGVGAGSTVVVASSMGALAAKLAVTIAIVGTLGATGVKGISVYRAHHPQLERGAVTQPSLPSEPSQAAAPTTDRSLIPSAPVAPVAETPLPDVGPSTAPQAKHDDRQVIAASPGPSASASTLEAETRLLRDAEALRRAGEGARALALLDEHAARFPTGLLVEERAAARVFALCDVGRVVDATAEAERFLAEHPRSLLAPRVRASCAAARAR